MTASLPPPVPHPPRYETCWLPLLAKLPASGALPPPDVEWVWAVHLLSPASYIKDCEAKYGTLIGRDESVRRRRAVAVPLPAPAHRARTSSRSPAPPAPSQAFPLGANSSAAVKVWEQHYPTEPCAAPVSCPCQLPLPAAWAPAQLTAACHLRYAPPDMSTPLPAGFASQLSYDIAAAVERQAMPQPPHQLLHCRHRRRRATANNGLPLPCTSAGGLQLPSIIAALL